jgi:hypothetical protein
VNLVEAVRMWVTPRRYCIAVLPPIAANVSRRLEEAALEQVNRVRQVRILL